jgi:hypothetical protein
VRPGDEPFAAGRHGQARSPDPERVEGLEGSVRTLHGVPFSSRRVIQERSEPLVTSQ